MTSFPGASTGPIAGSVSGPIPGPTADPAAPRGVRKATRDTEAPVIGGVASGLARHLGLPVLWVRAAFLLAGLMNGLGVVLYGGLWLVLPADTRFETSTPGGESATRGGRRPGRIRRLADAGPAIALAALGLGVVLVVQAVFGIGAWLWPLLLAVAGIGLLWRQADEAQRERWLDSTERVNPLQLVVGGGWAGWLRIGIGSFLLLLAVTLVVVDNGAMMSDGWGSVVAAGFVIAGIAVVFGPWLQRLAADLSAEREERIRTQERADMAAHLHDSVLQTLALIQKNAGDATSVARLARSQERDLRSWLYAGDSISAETLAGALRLAAAQVEDTHGVSVDVVAVGDAPFGDRLHCIVAAAREAMVNAGKHAAVERVDVYAEIGPTLAEVFVRDRGAGFHPATVPDDRHGVSGSIIDRMTRHGGSAVVRSAPGEGTEVRLSLPLEAAHE